MHPYIKPVHDQYALNANATNAAGAKAYMKDQFEFFGIKTPERRAITKEYMKKMGLLPAKELIEIVKELWSLDQRECQYFAIELLNYHQPLWKEDIIDLIEFCLVNKSWWDTVDSLSSECTGPYFMLFPQQTNVITHRWNTSSNIWLQRSSLLFQKNYKSKTDTDLLANYIRQLAPSQEFFIKKAIGWVLREYAKTNKEWVLEFVKRHTLSMLSRKEALKHIAPINS